MNLVAMTANSSKLVDQHHGASAVDRIVGSHTRLKYCCVGKLPLVKTGNDRWQLRLRGSLSYLWSIRLSRSATGGRHTVRILEGRFARRVAAARYFWLSSTAEMEKRERFEP